MVNCAFHANLHYADFVSKCTFVGAQMVYLDCMSFLRGWFFSASIQRKWHAYVKSRFWCCVRSKFNDHRISVIVTCTFASKLLCNVWDSPLDSWPMMTRSANSDAYKLKSGAFRLRPEYYFLQKFDDDFCSMQLVHEGNMVTVWREKLTQALRAVPYTGVLFA